MSPQDRTVEAPPREQHGHLRNAPSEGPLQQERPIQSRRGRVELAVQQALREGEGKHVTADAFGVAAQRCAGHGRREDRTVVAKRPRGRYARLAFRARAEGTRDRRTRHDDARRGSASLETRVMRRDASRGEGA